MEPILNGIFVDGQAWVVEHPEKLFKLGDFDVVYDDRMGSVVSKRNISIEVHVGLSEECLGFPYEEVFVHLEESAVDKGLETSAREVALMVSSDG